MPQKQQSRKNAKRSQSARTTSRRNPPGGRQRRPADMDSKHSTSSQSSLQTRSYPAPVSMGRTLYFAAGSGMANLLRHRFQYQAGYVYVGNGTLGAASQVYFAVNGLGSQALAYVPVMPADATFGQSYITDIAKHYARKVVHTVRLHILPISASNSSATGVDVVLAPYRGGSIDVSMDSGKVAAPTATNIIGSSGAVQFPIWKGHTMDLTPYIAGGSGREQNEFNIGSATASTSDTQAINSWVVPCAYILSGDAPSTTYDGSYIGRIYVEIVMSFLDFIGGLTQPNPSIRDGQSRKESEKTCAAVCQKHGGSAELDMAYVRIEEPLSAPTPVELRQLALTRQSATPLGAGTVVSERKRP
jgi:hypothetical protein